MDLITRNNKAKYLICLTIILMFLGCSKQTMNGTGSSSDSSNSPPEVLFTGPDPNEGLDVRKMAANAASYAITYGALSEADISILKTYPLVIVHPYSGNVSRSQIMRIKQGVDPLDNSDNPVVLCYISIGEDDRTFGLSDAQMLADPRFVGDGSGPSIDPRGAYASGTSLVGIDPLGTPTHGGFASYYLNDNAVRCKGSSNKTPDIDSNFNVRFVNAGDPKWYDLLNNSIMDASNHTPPGLKEMLKPGVGKNLGCDGVFLDTIDTAAPNSYTLCSDADYSSSEWTAKGFTDFIQRVRNDYPNKVILQNRGLFFFDPRQPHYQVSARGIIDIGFFESYYLGNNSDTVVSSHFPDNKYNVAPKIMAEANRPDGFKVLSLGYANGFDAPKPGIGIQTLLIGPSGLGFDILMTDVNEALAVGFLPYITSASVDFVNSFVKNNRLRTDTTPPQWSSVYNSNYNSPVGPPNPRIGIQKIAVGVGGSVTVSWDVAVDMNKVRYVLYYKTSPFDFNNMSAATRIVLTSLVGDGYSTVWSAANPDSAMQSYFPYQSTISGLQQGISYDFVIRAIDSAGNEDTNTVKKSATP